VTWS